MLATSRRAEWSAPPWRAPRPNPQGSPSDSSRRRAPPTRRSAGACAPARRGRPTPSTSASSTSSTPPSTACSAWGIRSARTSRSRPSSASSARSPRAATCATAASRRGRRSSRSTSPSTPCARARATGGSSIATSGPTPSSSSPTASRDAEHFVESRRRAQRLRAALASIPSSNAEAVVLHDVLGHNLAEIAQPHGRLGRGGAVAPRARAPQGHARARRRGAARAQGPPRRSGLVPHAPARQNRDAPRDTRTPAPGAPTPAGVLVRRRQDL